MSKPTKDQKCMAMQLGNLLAAKLRACATLLQVKGGNKELCDDLRFIGADMKKELEVLIGCQPGEIWDASGATVLLNKLPAQADVVTTEGEQLKESPPA